MHVDSAAEDCKNVEFETLLAAMQQGFEAQELKLEWVINNAIDRLKGERDMIDGKELAMTPNVELVGKEKAPGRQHLAAPDGQGPLGAAVRHEQQAEVARSQKELAELEGHSNSARLGVTKSSWADLTEQPEDPSFAVASIIDKFGGRGSYVNLPGEPTVDVVEPLRPHCTGGEAAGRGGRGVVGTGLGPCQPPAVLSSRCAMGDGKGTSKRGGSGLSSALERLSAFYAVHAPQKTSPQVAKIIGDRADQ